MDEKRIERQVLSEEELINAYDHARDFLAENDQELTWVERVSCLSVVGMYHTIRERDRQIAELAMVTETDRVHRLALQNKGLEERNKRQSATIRELEQQNAAMREVLEAYAWEPNYTHITADGATTMARDKGGIAREALAKLGGTSDADA